MRFFFNILDDLKFQAKSAENFHSLRKPLSSQNILLRTYAASKPQ